MNNPSPMSSRDSMYSLLPQTQLTSGLAARLVTLCLLLIPVGAASGQGSFRVDTLWTLRPAEFGFHHVIQGGAIGGSSKTMLYATQGVPDRDSMRIYEVDLSTGRIKDSMNTGLVGEVLDFAFAENSGEFAIATRPWRQGFDVKDVHIIGIWDWNTRQRLHTLRDTIDWLDGSDPYIGITSDGRRLFNATTGTMYDTRSGQKLFTSGRCYATVKPVFTRDNRIVSTHMRYDTTLQPNNSFVVRLRDVETGDYLATFPSGPGWIYLQTISDDGRYVAVGSSTSVLSEGSIRIYDRENQQVAMDTTWYTFEKRLSTTWLLFTPGGTGFFMRGYDLDVWNGEKIVAPAVYRSMGDWTPRQYFGHFGADKPPPQHTADWEYEYMIGGASIYCSRINLQPLSVEDAAGGEPRPTIIPNPVYDQFEVQGLVNITGAMDVQIADATGRIVFDKTMVPVNGNVTINVTELLSGTYLVRLRSMGEVVFSSQFVKF